MSEFFNIKDTVNLKTALHVLAGLFVFASVTWTQRKVVFWHKERVGGGDF